MLRSYYEGKLLEVRAFLSPCALSSAGRRMILPLVRAGLPSPLPPPSALAYTAPVSLSLSLSLPPSPPRTSVSISARRWLPPSACPPRCRTRPRPTSSASTPATRPWTTSRRTSCSRASTWLARHVGGEEGACLGDARPCLRRGAFGHETGRPAGHRWAPFRLRFRAFAPSLRLSLTSRSSHMFFTASARRTTSRPLRWPR